MYVIKLFNPHKQFGVINYSMTFEDTDEVIPAQRWEKKYPDTVTKAQAVTDIKKTIRAYAEEQGITWSDAKLNGVEVSVDVRGGTKLLWEI